MNTSYVIDSNVLLIDAHNLYTIGDDTDTVVIPETVLDEVDAKKSGLGEVAYQAREFGRLITQAKYTGTVNGGNTVFTNYKLNNRIIVIVSLKEYPPYVDTDRAVINDRKIIACALGYKSKVKKEERIVLLTNDIACLIRAQSLGLESEQLREVEDVPVSYHRELELADVDFRSIHGKEVVLYDKEYTHSFYNYVFTNKDTGQKKLATVKNGVVNVLGKESEQELRKQEVNPINAGQLLMSRVIQDQTIPLVVVEAPSGTGKTSVAISNAIKLVKMNSPYTGILYIRISIDDIGTEDEAIGFLKGSLEEKNSIYFTPLVDVLGMIAKNRLKNRNLKGVELEDAIADTVELIKLDCNITAMTGLGLRGRTFENSVVIIDEIQNASKQSLRKILTRFGKDCKIILIGSNLQIDSKYVTKYTNGLSVLLEAATEPQSIDMHVVQLDKVVRSDFAEFAEKLFD